MEEEKEVEARQEGGRGITRWLSKSQGKTRMGRMRSSPRHLGPAAEGGCPRPEGNKVKEGAKCPTIPPP